MSIFRTKGYRNVDCALSIAAIFPPEKKYRISDDRKGDDELTFHITIVNNKDMPDERSAYIPMDKGQLRELKAFIENYLKTGVTTEL